MLKALKELKHGIICNSCSGLSDTLYSTANCPHTLCSKCIDRSCCPKCSVKFAPKDLIRNLILDEIVSLTFQLEASLDAVPTITKVDSGAAKCHVGVDCKRSTIKRRGSNVDRRYLEKRNAKGETRLQAASIKGVVEKVQQLLAAGANPCVKDNAGWTPLHEAAIKGHTEIVRLLVEGGAEINVLGDNDQTPLHDAISSENLDCARFLIAKGADVSIRNGSGLTPIECSPNDDLREELLKFLNEFPACMEKLPLQALTSPLNCPENRKTSEKEPSRIVKQNTCTIIHSGLSKSQKAQLTLFASRFSVKILNSFSSEVTHLIVSVNENNRCPRTLKYLQCCLTGKWIVGFSWVLYCIQHNDISSEATFEVYGSSASSFEGTPRHNRLLALSNKEFGVFQGCNFLLLGDFTCPSKTDLVTMITTGGGRVLGAEPDKKKSLSTSRNISELKNCRYIVVSCKQRCPLKIVNRLATVTPVWILETAERKT